MLIALQKVNYSIGGIRLLDDASLSVNETDRIALIGRNGCGKSTLMNILAGKVSIDAGRRVVASNTSILLVKQELPNADVSPIEFLKESDLELSALYEQVDATEADEVGEIFEKIALIEDERYGATAVQVLLGLGISLEQQERPMRELSGGLLMRISLASALLQQPQLLLLDEPTNHLDLPSVLWLTTYLKAYPRPFVLISHDRELLNEVVNTTYHLQGGRLTRYNGNFTTYVEQRELSRQQAVATIENTDKKIAQMEKFVAAHKSDPKWAGSCSTREKWMRDMEEARPELDHEAPPIPIQFLPCSTLSDPLVQATHCDVAYGATPILSDVNLSIQTRSRIGILGMNGQGKSTLMRMLMQQLVNTTGEFFSSARLRVGYFSQNQSDIMSDELTVLDQLKLQAEPSCPTEDLLSHLLQFGFKRAQCGALVGSLSGGEKSRLTFAMIAYQRPHLIIMDEPTNHLDFETRTSLINAIREFNGAIVLVSHDWDLLENTMSEYWLVRGGQVKPYTHDLSFYRQAILSRFSPTPLASGKQTKLKEAAKPVAKDTKKAGATPYSSGEQGMLFAASKKDSRKAERAQSDQKRTLK